MGATSARETNESPVQAPIPRYRRSAFVRASYRAVALWTVGGTAGFALLGWPQAIGFLLGALVATASFWTLEQTLSWMYRSKRGRRRWVPVALVLFKYCLLGVVLYYVVSAGRVPMAPFSAGVCVVFVAVISYVIYRAAVASIARGRVPRAP